LRGIGCTIPGGTVLSSKITVICAFVLGAMLIVGSVRAYAHNGVNDGDDAPPPVLGTPLQELYPGVYSFEDSINGNINRVPSQVVPPAGR
jgi:hypothetical protein